MTVREFEWDQLVELALKLEPLLRKKAKENQGKRNDIRQNSARSESKETRRALAKIAGVSHAAVDQVKKVTVPALVVRCVK